MRSMVRDELYSSPGQFVVAQEYRHILSNYGVNICRAKSDTRLFVPHPGIVTMTTFGMECQPIHIQKTQIFGYNGTNQFILLPHLLEILGLRENNPVLSNQFLQTVNHVYRKDVHRSAPRTPMHCRWKAASFP